MECPYSGCLLKCRTKAVHRGKYAGIATRWKKRVLQLGKSLRTESSNGESLRTENPREEKLERSKMIDYEKLRELRILWPLDT